MSETTYWNGLETTARKVTGVVPPHDPEKHPTHAWWAGFDSPALPGLVSASPGEDLQGHRIEAVEVILDGVNAGGGISYLDNRDGSGWAKVTEGHGSPRWPHRNVPLTDIEYIR